MKNLIKTIAVIMILGIFAVGVSELEYLLKILVVKNMPTLHTVPSLQKIYTPWLNVAMTSAIAFVIDAIATFIGSLLMGMGGLGDRRITRMTWVLVLIVYDRALMLMTWGGTYFIQFYSSIYSGPAATYVVIEDLIFVAVVVLTALWGMRVGRRFRRRRAPVPL